VHAELVGRGLQVESLLENWPHVTTLDEFLTFRAEVR
jgi:hypothetical protein